MAAKQQETSFRRVGPDSRIPQTGTCVKVEGLFPGSRALLSQERVASYLSVQLREILVRLKDRADVVVASTGESDRRVEPKRWAGRPWASDGKPKKINTRFGVMSVNLFLLPDDTSGETRVSVTSNGAYGYQRINDLDQLNMYPWNTTKVQGNIDFPAADVRPSRDGFVPGKVLDEFISQISALTERLGQDVREQERHIQSELDKKTQQRLMQALAEAWRELDPAEYNLFRTRGANQPGEAPDGVAAGTLRSEVDQAPESTLALSKCTIRPAELYLLPNQTSQLWATARDALGRRIRNGVTFQWTVSKGARSVLFDSDPSAPSVSLLATSVFGEALIKVKVRQGNTEIVETSQVHVVKRLPRKETIDRTKSGIPPPTPEDHLGEGWRSKYDADLHQIIYNTGHADYRRSVTAGRKDEYILTVMAKELLLLNYSTAQPAELLERMVEVIPTVLRHY